MFSRQWGRPPSHFWVVCIWLFASTWTIAHQVSQSFTNSWSCSNTCPSSRWCHPTIWVSVILFSSSLLSFPASRSFPMSQYFASDGQSTGASASALELLLNIQDWFPLVWTGLHSPRDSQESSLTPQFGSINSAALSFLLSLHMCINTCRKKTLIVHSFIQWKCIMHLICTFLFHLILKETKAN